MEDFQIGDISRANLYLGRVQMSLVKAVAKRRQQPDYGQGERPPASIAAGPVGLVSLTKRSAGGEVEPVTPPGYRTAKRADPAIIRNLGEDDPRRRVVAMLCEAVERVGAVKGANLAGSDSSSVFSDGGATTRVKHAARYRLIEAAANRWPIDRSHGPVSSAPLVVLSARANNRNRYSIKAFDALIWVCVFGWSLDRILINHGWSAQSFNRNRLRDGLLKVLDDAANSLGYARGDAGRGA